MIGLLALVVGVVLGLMFSPQVPDLFQPYLPIAVIVDTARPAELVVLLDTL